MALRFSTPASNPTNVHGTFSYVGTGFDIPLTVMCWGMVSVDRNNYSDLIAAYTLQSVTDWNLFHMGTDVNGTTMMGWDGHSGQGTTTGRSMTVGSWYRFATVASSGSSATFYHGDGTPTSAMTATSYSDLADGNLYTGTAEVFTLSSISSNTEFCFNGRIAAIKAYDVALSAAEVEQELMRYRPLRVTNLLSWVPCIERASFLNPAGTPRTSDTANTRNFVAMDYGPASYGFSTSTSAGYVTPTFEDGPPIPW